MFHPLPALGIVAVALTCSAATETVTVQPAPASVRSSAPVPGSAPGTPAASPRAGRLSWSPPALVNPITRTLCNCNIIDDEIVVDLNLGQDYILKDPVVLNHPVVIQGGHNVVWIGGEIRTTLWPPWMTTE